MSEEDGFSLLGALAEDLQAGLDAAQDPYESHGRDDGAESTVGDTSSRPWTARQALIRAERSADRLPDEAKEVAVELLVAAGLLARAQPTWSITSAGSTFELSEGAIICGRNSSQGATLLVDHPIVSRVQCTVGLESGVPVARHRGTVNPTLVHRGGSEIVVDASGVPLRSGDQVSVDGDVVLFSVFGGPA